MAFSTLTSSGRWKNTSRDKPNGRISFILELKYNDENNTTVVADLGRGSTKSPKNFNTASV